MAIERAAMLGIPTVAIGLTAAVLLGPGATRPALGARVYGAPAAAPAPVNVRIVTLTSLFGVEEAVSTFGLVVQRPGGQGLWGGASGAEGVAEAGWLAKDSAEQIEILADHRIIARGVLDLSRSHPTIVGGDAWLDGPRRGDLKVHVASSGAPFAVGARGSLFVHVEDGDGHALDAAEVKLTAPGAKVADAKRPDDGTVKAFAVTPEFHLVDVEIDATAGDRTGHWEGTLPVVPGAMLLAPDEAGYSIVSPVDRERAFVSVWGANGRLSSAVVSLTRRADGMRASAPLDQVFLLNGVAVTLSSDPFEQSVGTVTWPLGSGRRMAPALDLMLDGMPQALAAERGRAWRVRRWGLLVLASAAAAEILLLLARSRRAQAHLEAHLAKASGEEDGEALRAADSPTGYWALASAGLIAFAFAIIAALAAFH